MVGAAGAAGTAGAGTGDTSHGSSSAKERGKPDKAASTASVMRLDRRDVTRKDRISCKCPNFRAPLERKPFGRPHAIQIIRNLLSYV